MRHVSLRRQLPLFHELPERRLDASPSGSFLMPPIRRRDLLERTRHELADRQGDADDLAAPGRGHQCEGPDRAPRRWTRIGREEVVDERGGLLEREANPLERAVLLLSEQWGATEQGQTEAGYSSSHGFT